jgi:hypothetical protein
MLVIAQGSEVDDVFAAEWQAAWRPACCQQQLLVSNSIACGERDLLVARIDGRDFSSVVEISAALGRAAPDLLDRFALP